MSPASKLYREAQLKLAMDFPRIDGGLRSKYPADIRTVGGRIIAESYVARVIAKLNFSRNKNQDPEIVRVYIQMLIVLGVDLMLIRETYPDRELQADPFSSLYLSSCSWPLVGPATSNLLHTLHSVLVSIEKGHEEEVRSNLLHGILFLMDYIKTNDIKV